MILEPSARSPQCQGVCISRCCCVVLIASRSQLDHVVVYPEVMWDLCRVVSDIDGVFCEAPYGSSVRHCDVFPDIHLGLISQTVGLSHMVALAVYHPW